MLFEAFRDSDIRLVTYDFRPETGHHDESEDDAYGDIVDHRRYFVGRIKMFSAHLLIPRAVMRALYLPLAYFLIIHVVESILPQFDRLKTPWSNMLTYSSSTALIHDERSLDDIASSYLTVCNSLVLTNPRPTPAPTIISSTPPA
jgi:hypothetical protein